MSATNEVTGAAKDQAGAVAATTKDQAANVAGTAGQAAKDVAGTAKDQAATVATEVKTQARDLLGETREQVRSQTDVQTKRLASTVRSVASELQGLASGKNETPGAATDIVRQLADRANTVASRLEDSSPEQLLDDLRRFARQRTGLFLFSAGAAGFLAARLVKAASANKEDASTQYSTAALTSPSYRPAVSAAPTTGTWETASMGAATTEPSYYGSQAVADPSPTPATSALAGDLPDYGSTGYRDPDYTDPASGIRPVDPLLDDERGLR